MHLSNIIVNARAGLTAAEHNYSLGLKGTAAEDLAGLSVLIQDNLTIIKDSLPTTGETAAETSPKAE